MKKSLIALGVAAGMFGVAHADTTNLYGALGFSMKVENNGYNKNSVGRTVKDNVWDLATHTARFGIKGTEDLSNGLQAFFKFEFGVDAASNAYEGNSGGVSRTRFAHIGLRGDFGTITLGRQDSLWKVVMNKGVFNDVFDNDNDAMADLGDYGLGRVGKAISYASPSFGGFQFAGSVIFDGHNTASKAADAYEVAALYKNYGVDAGVVYTNAKERNTAGRKDTTEYLGLNAGYEMEDTFNVNFGAGHKSSEGYQYALQGEYFLGANTFRAGFAYEDKAKTGHDPITFALGYQYNFSKRTYVWVEGDYTDYDNFYGRDRDDGYRVFVGARHDF